MNIFAWVFMPTDTDLAAQAVWPYPAGYVKASSGQVVYRAGHAIPMNDIASYEPGWKRLIQMDAAIADA